MSWTNKNKILLLPGRLLRQIKQWCFFHTYGIETARTKLIVPLTYWIIVCKISNFKMRKVNDTNDKWPHAIILREKITSELRITEHNCQNSILYYRTTCCMNNRPLFNSLTVLPVFTCQPMHALAVGEAQTSSSS